MKKIFNIRAKNESVHKNLMDVERKVAKIKEINSQRTNFLEKNDNLFVQGRSSSSQSKTRGGSVELIRHKRQNTETINSNLLMNMKKTILKTDFSTPQRSLKKDKSTSMSLGKTTASSMSNLVKNSKNK